MPKIKKSSKPEVPLVFLKRLVTLLSVVMILGFLFIITILGIKISNFNTTPQKLSEPPNREILIPNGKIENVGIEKKTLTIVVRVSAGHLEIIVVDLKNGILLNQYSVKQKKSPYNQ